MQNWKYNAVNGIWTEELLGYDVLQRAVQLAGESARWIALNEDHPKLPKRGERVTLLFAENEISPYELRTMEVREYGAYEEVEPGADVGDKTLEKLAKHLANTITAVTAWTALPELRRIDGSYFRCEVCGARLGMPTDLGRNNPGRDHTDANPSHMLTFVVQPGDFVGWYGIGLGEPTETTLEEVKAIS